MPITIGTPVVKGLTQKFEDNSLALMKPVQIPSFISIGTTVIELCELKEKKKKKKFTWTK